MLKATRLLHNEKIDVTLRMTIHKLNYNEVSDFIHLAKKLKVSNVGIRLMVPTGRGLENWLQLKISPEEYKELLQNAYRIGKNLVLRFFMVIL